MAIKIKQVGTNRSHRKKKQSRKTITTLLASKKVDKNIFWVKIYSILFYVQLFQKGCLSNEICHSSFQDPNALRISEVILETDK
jgi:hypothetical protein